MSLENFPRGWFPLLHEPFAQTLDESEHHDLAPRRYEPRCLLSQLPRDLRGRRRPCSPPRRVSRREDASGIRERKYTRTAILSATAAVELGETHAILPVFAFVKRELILVMALMARHSSSQADESPVTSAPCFFFFGMFQGIQARRAWRPARDDSEKPGGPEKRASRAEAKTSRRREMKKHRLKMHRDGELFSGHVSSHRFTMAPFFCEQGRRPPAISGCASPRVTPGARRSDAPRAELSLVESSSVAPSGAPPPGAAGTGAHLSDVSRGFSEQGKRDYRVSGRRTPARERTPRPPVWGRISRQRCVGASRRAARIPSVSHRYDSAPVVCVSAIFCCLLPGFRRHEFPDYVAQHPVTFHRRTRGKR